MKITKRQLKRIIREEKNKVVAENRIRQMVRSALLNENWWMDNKIDGSKPPTFPESANSEYSVEAGMTFSPRPKPRHQNHIAAGSPKLIGMYIRMQLQDVSGAGLTPEELEQLKSLQAYPTTGREDVPYMYPAIVDRLPDFHDPAYQEKFRPIADKVRKDAEAAWQKREAERAEEAKKRAERAAKRKRNKSGKAYDKYLNSIADMQRNMDAVDELSNHVNAIAKAGGKVGEMAEDFIEEILEPSINYNDDDINGLLGQLDGEIKDAIMKKFNPSSNINELKQDNEMKITKRQLRRIIKEEKQKLLVEMNPLANADRMLSMGIPYAMQNQLTDLLNQMMMKAMDDLVEDGEIDEEDADFEGSNAVMMALANSLQSIGFTNAYDAMVMAINRAQGN